MVIDCIDVEWGSDFWSAYVRSADPEGAGFFGRNLDALWDGLNGGPGWPGECHPRFVNASALKPLRGGMFLDALRDIASRSSLVKVDVE